MWYLSALGARENRLSGTRRGRVLRKKYGDKGTFKKKRDIHKGKPTAVTLEKHSKRSVYATPQPWGC